jgi:hypothetical protein
MTKTFTYIILLMHSNERRDICMRLLLVTNRSCSPQFLLQFDEARSYHTFAQSCGFVNSNRQR